MVAFNFKEAFAPDVEAFIKTQTVRSSKRCEVGDKIQLYTGQRTKACRKLGDAICTGIAKIRVTEDCPWSLSDIEGVVHTTRDGKRFHELDGFMNAKEFVDFFRAHYGLPFSGWLHVWEADDGQQ